MAVNSIFVFSIVFLLLITLQTAPSFSKNVLTEDNGQEQEADKDLSLLEDETEVVLSDEDPFSNFHNYENYDDLEDDVAADDSYNDESYMPPEVDEKDVLVLKESNFSEFIRKNKHVMVEFYAPWCGHCQALVPEYATAATELKKEDVVLAKVDATEEAELAQKYDVQGFPTVYFFVNGIHKQYPGQRSKDAIVTWVKKKIGPSLHNITTIEEAEHILATEPKVVLCYLDALVGSDSDELSAVSSLEDDVNFYQTNSPDVAKLFHIDPLAKRPALVLIKQEDEKVSHFDDQFSKSAISEFVYKNKLPLVTHFTREGAPQIFDNPIKNQVILFAGSHDLETLLPIFQEAAKAFKGKLLFVYVESDNEDVGKPVSEYFGVKEGATSVLAYTGNEDARKFLMDGDFSVSNIKSFGEKFLEDNLKPFYKSDPIPEKNDGDVKVVVGNNFDEIVLDESKDVLLEIYDPSCGHCKSLEPIYNKLGRHLRGIDSLIIAKMDGTTNEHPRAKQDGFPTLLFFPAGNKSFDPITVDTDRTVVDFYKFLKKHATIPFKLKKPASYDVSKASESSSSKQEEGIDNEVKDEL